MIPPKLRPDLSTRRNAVSRDSAVVALDGTAVAERALPMALMLARHWNVRLRLVHVRNPAEDGDEMQLRLNDNSRSLSVQSRREAYLKSLAESLSRQQRVLVNSRVVTGTSIAGTLRSMCDTNTRALVMLRPRRSGFSRFWMGSVTNSLIGHSPVPLMLIPDNESSAVRAGNVSRGFNRILVHFDGTDASECVLGSTMALTLPDALCHLLKVLPFTSLATGRSGFHRAFDVRHEASGVLSGHLRDKASIELFRAKEKLESRGYTATSRLIFDGQSPGSAIVEEARATQADVIVLSARPYLLPWWLRQGVAEYVVRHATVPVLIIPADGAAGCDVDSQPEVNHVDLN